MKKIIILIGGVLLMSGLTGCGMKNQKEIEQSFDKVLAMYPTKNLEEFYDLEGYRDSEFSEDDKGVWVLNSEMSVTEKKEGVLQTEGMVLRMNRNTRTAKGFYYTSEISSKLDKKVEEKKYPVIYVEKAFYLVQDSFDKKINEKLKNFEFFVQYGDFDKLDTYENIKKMYNPEVPMYELEYQLTNDDVNVQALRKRYNILADEAPLLLLKGQGDLEGSSVGYKQLEITFDKKTDVFFVDSIDFQPSSSEDMTNE